jgi:hypothetical protein
MTKRSGKRLSPEEKKSKLLNQLLDVRGRILAKASRLPVDYADEVFLGTWSIMDLLAHLVGWDKTNLDAAKSILKGELPSFYAHYDRNWATYNAELVAKYRQDDLQEMIAKTKDAHRELMQFLKSIPASEMYKDRGIRVKGYKVTLARLLQVEKEDEEQHFQEISAFVDPLPQA